MNVSSVKNLNGEVFSAVQDASLTNVVQSNSAQWSEGGSGDEEVNSFVYNNSSTIVDVDNSYKANSGSFLTAAPSDMATTGELSELAQTMFGTFYPNTNPLSFVSENWVTAQGYITGVSITESATWNEVSTTVQTNSAQWAEGGGAEIVNHDNTLSGNGTVDSPLGVILSATNDANVNNIIVTASLPATPDANTLYLIPEE